MNVIIVRFQYNFYINLIHLPKYLQINLCCVSFIVTVDNLKETLYITKFFMVLQIPSGIQQDSQ